MQRNFHNIQMVLFLYFMMGALFINPSPGRAKNWLTPTALKYSPMAKKLKNNQRRRREQGITVSAQKMYRQERFWL